jgi:hypothetical protein
MLSELDMTMPRQALQAFDQVAKALGLQVDDSVEAEMAQAIVRYRFERAGFTAVNRIKPTERIVRKAC